VNLHRNVRRDMASPGEGRIGGYIYQATPVRTSLV